MAVSAGGATLQVVPQLVKSFSRDLVQQMAGPAQKAATKTGKEHGRRFGMSFSGGVRTGIGPVKGIMRGFGPQMAAAFGGAAIVAGIKSVTDEARVAAAVGRITEARLKSTGGAAKVSAAQIASLAESLSNKVGVDDDLIQSGENLLLTFKGVRNEAGKGNDIFTQTTKLAVDLAAGMNGGKVSAEGLKGANIQLGKALENPIKGITALTRSGVSFSDAEKEQIRTMVEHGDTLGAQKLILKAVAGQFAGTAAASTDAGKRFGVFVGNMKEKVGGVLLPILDDIATLLLDKVVPAVSAFAAKHGPAFKAVLSAVAKVFSTKIVPALSATVGWLKEHSTLVLSVAGAIGTIVAALKVWQVVTKAMAIAQGVLNVVMAANPVGLVVLAIAGLVAGLVIAYHKSKTFRDIVNGTWKAIKSSVLTAVSFIITALRGWLNMAFTVVGGILTVFGKLPGPMGAPFRAAAQAVKDAKKTINTQIDAIQNKIDGLKGKDIKITAEAAVRINDSVRMYLKAASVPGFHATGGAISGPGTGTSDSVPAWLSAGEHVWTAAEVKKAGGHGAVEAMRRQVRGYASGGAVHDLGRFESKTITATERLGGRVARFLASAIGKGLSKALSEGIGGGSAAIKAFIKSTDALPYVWGAAGPGAYDCSGIVSAVLGKMTGKGGGHGQRYFTTSSIHSGILGIKPGLGGTLQIGVTAGTGHMAGRYGGLGFEAEGSRTGIKIGGAASTPESFARRFHLARGGRITQDLARAFARSGADVGGDPGRLRINGKVLDRGGHLMPGQIGVNLGRRPERVLGPAEQIRLHPDSIKALAAELRENPPITRVSDVHKGLLAKKRRGGGQRLGLD